MCDGQRAAKSLRIKKADSHCEEFEKTLVIVTKVR